MEDPIISRKEHSSTTLERARSLFSDSVSKWGAVEDLRARVCVYATGSFGRNDASAYSDLDVFVVALEEDGSERRLLTGLEEVELLATIIQVNRELNLPPLDGDGGFLKAHSIRHYLVGLGKPQDDANNTFTGRLLLLLESQPIFGESVFQRIRRDCLDQYWVDFSDHHSDFLPSFLVNDILRFWRTLCINYESGEDQFPEKRRAKNLKLKYSRLLTCFSAIVGMHVEFQKNSTVTIDSAIEILNRSPMDRLIFLKTLGNSEINSLVDSMCGMYRKFLNDTNCEKRELYEKMKDQAYYRASLTEARDFGDAMFELMQHTATSGGVTSPGGRFFRYITI